MTPQQMLNAAHSVQQRWPDAIIRGFYANASVSLEVIQDGMVVALVSCRDGCVSELKRPKSADRTLIRFG